MILPKKHIKLSESLFAIGGVILINLNGIRTVDQIWSIISSQKYSQISTSFDNYILALDYLYTIGAIDIDENGGIFKCI